MSEELPRGWASVRLSELVEFNPKHPTNLADSTLVTFAPMAAVSESSPHLDTVSTRPLGEVRKGYTHFADGDVLFAKITPCMENGKGAVAADLANGIGCGTTELVVMRSRGAIEPQLLYRFLAQPAVRRAAKENFTGTAGQARVPLSFLEELELPLPPLAEQRRIVAKLEEVLGKVDATRARLAKIPALLKRFRQSVLAAACSGRLTADWREENRTPNGSVDPAEGDDLPEIPEEWRWVKLPQTGEMNRGRSRHRPRNEPSLYGGPYPFIQTGDIAQSGGRITAHRQTYSELGLAQSRLWKAGTICITIAANIAESAVLTYPACFPDSVVGIIADTQIAKAEYIEFFIRVAKADLATFAPATAQKNINIGILNEVRVPLPPLPEQQEIVRRVEALFALADKLEARFQRAQAQVEKLTASVLARAFAGQLVPQDPADEPAVVLLERLRSKKAAAPSARPAAYPEPEPRELKVAEAAPGKRGRRRR